RPAPRIRLPCFAEDLHRVRGRLIECAAGGSCRIHLAERAASNRFDKLPRAESSGQRTGPSLASLGRDGARTKRAILTRCQSHGRETKRRREASAGGRWGVLPV